MTHEAQRIAIAEACGLSTKREQLGGVFIYRDKRGYPVPLLPDYPNDLNAMHEAEATLTGETNYYHQLLIRMNNYDGLATVRATAAQRAEAFLRTIGKWQETTTPPNPLAQVAEQR